MGGPFGEARSIYYQFFGRRPSPSLWLPTSKPPPTDFHLNRAASPMGTASKDGLPSVGPRIAPRASVLELHRFESGLSDPDFSAKDGRGDRIRTYDLLGPTQALYQ